MDKNHRKGHQGKIYELPTWVKSPKRTGAIQCFIADQEETVPISVPVPVPVAEYSIKKPR